MPHPFRVPRFYPILDTAVLAQRQCPLFAAAEALLNGNAKILQYRHKADWTQANYDEAAKLAALCHQAGVLFVLNDRADFAKLLGAALHVGQHDLPPVAARRIVRDEVMGFSTHNRQQLVFGDEEPVEYLSLGPIFATASKLKPDPVVGLEGLRKLRPLTKKPLVAIGGITLDNASQVFEAGANSVAVISGFLTHPYDKAALKSRIAEWIAHTDSA